MAGRIISEATSREDNPVVGWLSLVLAQAVWWLAILDETLLAGLLLLTQTALQWPRWHGQTTRWLPIALVAVSGLLVDALIVATGTVRFRDPLFAGIPLWLVVLWCSFALTMPTLLQLLPIRWLRTLVFVGAGPLAYIGGAALGAAQIAEPTRYAMLLIISWLLLPVLWWWIFQCSSAPKPQAIRIDDR